MANKESRNRFITKVKIKAFPSNGTTICCKHLNKINKTEINEQCNGKRANYHTPAECCKDANFIICPNPPCGLTKPVFDEIGNKTRQVVPKEQFEPLENEFYEKIDGPLECDELCENEGSGRCNAFVFNSRKFTCQLGMKCDYKYISKPTTTFRVSNVH